MLRLECVDVTGTPHSIWQRYVLLDPFSVIQHSVCAGLPVNGKNRKGASALLLAAQNGESPR